MAFKIILKYYYKVIPLTKIPLGRSPYFTYGSMENIPFGSLVQISFGKKQPRGIVCGKTQKSERFTVKEIQKIIAKEIITKNQMKLALFLSRYYYSPPGTVLKFFVPPIAKMSKQKIPAFQKDTNKITLTKKQLEATEKIIKGKPGSEFILFGPAGSGKTEIIMSLAKKTVSEGKQTLVLIPDIFLSYQEIQRYQERFGDLAVLLHSKMLKGEFFSNWRLIKSGKAKIIISTRMGVFLPFSNLGLIAIDEEQDSSHKSWDQSPKYSDKIAARELCQIHKAKLIYCSATPSVETLAKKNVVRVELPTLKTKKIEVKNPQIKIVDLRTDYFKRKTHFYSQQLLDELEQKMKARSQSIILAPRRGKSKAVLCEGCKKILKCKNCDLPLSSVGESFKCLHCNFKISALSKCPLCGSFKLKNLGFGAEKIAGDLKKIFPYARIAVADRETFQKEQTRKKMFSDLDKGMIDILVGTSTVIKGLNIDRISLAAVLSDSQFSGKSEYKFNEKHLGSLFQLAGRLNRPGSGQNGIFIAQTWSPENALLKYLQNWDWLEFSKEELRQRKLLKFPPYCCLIKLTIKDESLKRVEKKAQTMYDKISETKDEEIIDLMPPYFGLIRKTRNQWHKNLLLKAKNPHSRKLSLILGEMSKEWIIDIGPENVF